MLGNQIAVDAGEQGRDVGKGSLVLHLDSNSVEQLSAKLSVLNLRG